MAAFSCRSSFQQSGRKGRGESSPNNIRRSSESSFHRSSGSKRKSCIHNSAPYPVTTPLGFSPNEFLPLDYSNAKRKKNYDFLKKRKLDVSKLSDDALGMCLFTGFLDSFETARLRCVSKRIRRIASKQVHKLDLRKCENLTPTHVENIVSSFQNLTDLDFSYCSQFGGEELEKLVPISNTLKRLALKGSKVGDDSLANYLQQVNSLYGPSRLESIDLSAINKAGSVLIGDAALRSISLYCPNLNCLRLAWCSQLTDQGAQCLAALSNLSELDLSLTGITTKSCDHLLQMMMVSSPHTELKVLDLSATKITDEGIEKLFSARRSYCFTSISLRFLQDLTPALLELVIQQSPLLEFLDVTHSGMERKIQIEQTLSKTIQQRTMLQVKGVITTTTAANCR